MFEQTLIHPERRPWTVAASLTLQLSTVGALVLYSILHFEPLGPVMLRDPLPPLPALPAAVQVVAVQRAPGTHSSIGPAPQPRSFTAPARIPEGVASVVDEVPSAIAPAFIPGGGISTGVYGSIADPLQEVRTNPPPKPPAAPEVVEPKTQKLLRVGGQVLEAKILNRVVPVYPPLARAARVSGVVELIGVIGRDGTVQNLQVVSGHPLLVQAAVEAVKQWRYRPTLLNGEAVEVTAPIRVTFSLGG